MGEIMPPEGSSWVSAVRKRCFAAVYLRQRSSQCTDALQGLGDSQQASCFLQKKDKGKCTLMGVERRLEVEWQMGWVCVKGQDSLMASSDENVHCPRRGCRDLIQLSVEEEVVSRDAAFLSLSHTRSDLRYLHCLWRLQLCTTWCNFWQMRMIRDYDKSPDMSFPTKSMQSV